MGAARFPGMHLVLIAWLYLIGMMAATADSLARGLLLFVIAGVLPVLGLARWRGRQRDGADGGTTRSSGLEHDVHDGNDGDA